MLDSVAKIAQLVEQRTRNAQVLGSNPSLGSRAPAERIAGNREWGGKRLDTLGAACYGARMLRKALSAGVAVPVVLCLQVIPLLLLPPDSWSLSTQEWWLPVMLTAMVIVALVQLLGRRSRAGWPWAILSFAQGFNIISRLMMLLPHATNGPEGSLRFNALYVVFSVVAMLVSAFEIWYGELPEIRRRYA
jgi:hypothetical protein